MQKDVLYKDVPYEQLASVYNNPPNLTTGTLYRSGGAPIDNANNILVYRHEYQFDSEMIPTSGQYPEKFRSDDFFAPEMNHESSVIHQDSIISAPTNPSSQTIGRTGMDFNECHDTSVYARYKFSESAFDQNLPVYKDFDRIFNRIDTHPVLVIEGETGCGKTTQIPQMILHKSRERNRYCNIIVTQPRRIAAISVCKQVCMSNNWPIKEPGICGYQIGQEAPNTCESTRLLYCTTGVALRKLMGALKNRSNRIDKNNYFTHIIIDEVHERDREMDLLLLLVKKYRAHFPLVKIVIMSATIQAKKVATYFSNGDYPAPIFSIQGRQFNVATCYLDRIAAQVRCKGPRFESNRAVLHEECVEICVKIIQSFDSLEKGGMKGAVLVFLPGMSEIKIVEQALKSCQIESVPLHSDIPLEQQRKAFLPATSGKRKVILSTNIAESSVTVPDIRYVIDFCLNKVLYTENRGSHLDSLQLCWASKANCMQRAGRAGRVANGCCYRLVPEEIYRTFEEYPMPEILRASLCQTILQVKVLEMGSPRTVLANAIDPPQEERICKAIFLCKEVLALVPPKLDEHIAYTEEERQSLMEHNAYDGDLTFLGEILAYLPVDIRLGKLMVLGHMFGVAEDCISIAACLTLKTFFTKPFNNEFMFHKCKQLFANEEKSDLFAALKAMKNLDKNKSKQEFRQYGISKVNFLDVHTLADDLKNRLQRFGLDLRNWTENLNREEMEMRTSSKNFIIKIVIALAFYPNFFVCSKDPDTDLIKRDLAGCDFMRTMQIQRLPQNLGFFYHRELVNLFKCCNLDSGSGFRIFYEQSKAYIEFSNRLGMLLACKMRFMKNFSLKFPSYDETLLHYERERLLAEAKEFYSEQRRLVPNLIMMTDKDTGDAVPVPPSIMRSNQSVNSQSTSALMMKNVAKNYNIPRADQNTGQIQITYVVSCCRFYARFVPIDDESNGSDISKLNRILRSHLPGFEEVNIAELDKNEMYVALHHDPAFKYQRCKIVDFFPDEEMIHVSFVDIGDQAKVPFGAFFRCPSQVKDIKYQAVRCRLKGIQEAPNIPPEIAASKLDKNKFYMDSEGNKHLKTFDVEIFSVVSSQDQPLVVIDLFARKEDSVFSVGESFKLKRWAVQSEEPVDSIADNSIRARVVGERVESNDMDVTDTFYWPLHFSQIRLPREPLPYFLEIRIPPQPTEISWTSIVSGFGDQTQVRVATHSINSIALEEDLNRTSSYLLVAADAVKSAQTGIIQLKDTTILDPFPGLVPLMCMLASPSVELIKGRKQDKYPIGILCGLGPDPATMRSAFPDHDIFYNFDVEINEGTLKLLNEIRFTMNRMIDRENPVIKQNTSQFRKMQQDLIGAVISLFSVNPLPRIEIEYVTSLIKWNSKTKHWANIARTRNDTLKEISNTMHDYAREELSCQLGGAPDVLLSQLNLNASGDSILRRVDDLRKLAVNCPNNFEVTNLSF